MYICFTFLLELSSAKPFLTVAWKSWGLVYIAAPDKIRNVIIWKVYFSEFYCIAETVEW